jgi:hypothetical protein
MCPPNYHEGDELLSRDGRTLVIEAIDHRQFSGKVYNISVAELECYAVGRNDILVHNKALRIIPVRAKTPAGGGVRASASAPSAQLSPSNYPNPDPPMSAPPVRYEPQSIEDVVRMREGRGPTTRQAQGTSNIEAHHRQQVPVQNGGVIE